MNSRSLKEISLGVNSFDHNILEKVLECKGLEKFALKPVPDHLKYRLNPLRTHLESYFALHLSELSHLQTLELSQISVEPYQLRHLVRSLKRTLREVTLNDIDCDPLKQVLASVFELPFLESVTLHKLSVQRGDVLEAINSRRLDQPLKHVGFIMDSSLEILESLAEISTLKSLHLQLSKNENDVNRRIFVFMVRRGFFDGLNELLISFGRDQPPTNWVEYYDNMMEYSPNHPTMTNVDDIIVAISEGIKDLKFLEIGDATRPNSGKFTRCVLKERNLRTLFHECHSLSQMRICLHNWASYSEETKKKFTFWRS